MSGNSAHLTPLSGAKCAPYEESPACTLPQAALSDRLAEIQAIGADSLTGVVSEHELRFRNDAHTRDRLETLIQAEGHCCAAIAFDLRETGAELRLTITGPGSQAFHKAFTAG